MFGLKNIRKSFVANEKLFSVKWFSKLFYVEGKIENQYFDFPQKRVPNYEERNLRTNKLPFF